MTNRASRLRREVRYAAAPRYVRELCAESGAPRTAAQVCTAHTSSDRAETFLMNANKGSGPAGLSSIPRRRNIVVRPCSTSRNDEPVSARCTVSHGGKDEQRGRFVPGPCTPSGDAGRHSATRASVRRLAPACEISRRRRLSSQLSAQAFEAPARREAAAPVLDARRPLPPLRL